MIVHTYRRVTSLALAACALVGSVSLMTISCNSSGFSGEQDTTRTGNLNPAQGGAGNSHLPTYTGDDLDDSDRAALDTCLRNIGKHPFAGPQPAPVRRINASVSVLSVGRPIVDDVRTQGPELVLIGAAVNVLGGIQYKLHNPNAYYCLKVDVNVLASTQIELACGARLADNKVNVSVGSDAAAAGKVGVHVGSQVKVTRVGC